MKRSIRKYLSGQSDLSGQSRLLDWLRQEGNLSHFREERAGWEKETLLQPIADASKESWGSIQGKLLLRTQKTLAHTQYYLNLFRYAAIFLVLISLVSLSLYFSGRNGENALVYTTVRAEQGQIASLILPDQSEVWLNSGSSVRYDNEFSRTNRSIHLEGEAYFKVTKNPELPLVVQNDLSIDITVLGTNFNVSVYPEDPVFHVTLLEGKVELTSTRYRKIHTGLEPGEQAVFNKQTNELNIQKVNVGHFTSWKEGLINFYNIPLKEVAVKLAKRFNQKIEVDDDIKHLEYTYTIKNESLPEILKLMEKITPVNVVQKGDVIRIRGIASGRK